MGALFCDAVPDGLRFMTAEIVHDDRIARSELWCEAFPDIHLKDEAVHRAVHHQGGDDPVMAQARDESGFAPVAKGGAPRETVSLWAAAMAAHHVGLGPGFVEEDDAFGIETMLFSAPLLPRGGHIRPLLLVGENRFFYRQPCADHKTATGCSRRSCRRAH